MNNNKPKEKWGKPKLIMLIRGNRQEEVLTVCKTDGVTVESASRYGGCCSQFVICIACYQGGSS